MKAEEFDQAFDRVEDVSSALDLAAAQRPGLEQRRVNVDFPVWMIESLDREARRLGVTRQSVIKVWIAEHLERRDSAAALPGHPYAVGSDKDSNSAAEGGFQQYRVVPQLEPRRGDRGRREPAPRSLLRRGPRR